MTGYVTHLVRKHNTSLLKVRWCDIVFLDSTRTDQWEIMEKWELLSNVAQRYDSLYYLIWQIEQEVIEKWERQTFETDQLSRSGGLLFAVRLWHYWHV